MLSKIKDFWNSFSKIMVDVAKDVKTNIDKLPKPNPNVEVDWKDGQPEFKDKAPAANTTSTQPVEPKEEKKEETAFKFPDISLPKPNPNIDVEWKDGQPVFKEKKEKKKRAKKKD